jgi:hypothetical protein
VGVHRCRRHQREPRLAALSMGIGSPSTARSALRIIGCVRGTALAPAAPSRVKIGSADRVLGQRVHVESRALGCALWCVSRRRRRMGC